MTKRFIITVLCSTLALSSPCFYLAYKADQRAAKAEHWHNIYKAEQVAYGISY